MIGSFRETVVYWVGADATGRSLRGGRAAVAGGERATISAEIEEAIAGHPAVVAIDGFRGLDVTYEDSLGDRRVRPLRRDARARQSTL